MRDLPAAFRRHLQSGATTLCHCWKLTPKDNPPQGFTDHDRDILFGGVLYKAASGFTASAIESGLGLKIDNLEVEGALSSHGLSAEKIAAGFYDNADVEITRVNWLSPQERVLLRKGNLGEIRRTPHGFQAELRGLAHKLNQPIGRLYQYLCDADLGDRRCRVPLNDARFRASGSVQSPEGARLFHASALASYQDGHFTGGKISFASGNNNGFASEVRSHRKEARHALITLWQSAPHPLRQGDRFTISAGCDKRFLTCRAKFNNAVNFQGFPHMPGNDFAHSYARPQNAERA